MGAEDMDLPDTSLETRSAPWEKPLSRSCSNSDLTYRSLRKSKRKSRGWMPRRLKIFVNVRKAVKAVAKATCWATPTASEVLGSARIFRSLLTGPPVSPNYDHHSRSYIRWSAPH